MKQPARKVRVLEKGDRLVVFDGDKKIEDMVVYLLYRKLNSVLKDRKPCLREMAEGMMQGKTGHNFSTNGKDL